MKRLALRMILLASGSLLASGCVYKMSIQQGNYLVTESVSQLKEGMTRSQVRFLLGTPMVPDAFNNDRWDYYYFYSTRHSKQPLKRRLTVFFEEEKVARYENEGVPTKTDLEQLDRDLRKAIAATKNQRKEGFWKRTFGRDKTPPPEATEVKPSEEKSEGSATPDPVPASQPQPEPAGTPSGPS